MKRPVAVFCLLLLLIVSHARAALCDTQCVDAEGEATIIHGDVPSARLEATARAKWDAIEKTVGVDVKAGSLISNLSIVEDVIRTSVGGSVKRFTKKREDQRDGSLFVTIHACVEPQEAQKAIGSDLALNNGVVVFIPARRPTASGAAAIVEETNLLSETLIRKLLDQRYKVIDAVPSRVVDAKAMDRALQSGSNLALRSMMYQFLSNVIIVGKTDYTVSMSKGEDIGYGLSLPFNSVTVRLTYRIVARNQRTGNMEILDVRTEQGRGLRNNVEDAAADALLAVAEKISPFVLDSLAQYLQVNMKRIRVKVHGVKDLETNREIRGLIQNTVWGDGVEEKGMGEFTVAYPENTLYLANSLQQKGVFRLIQFTPYSLTLAYTP
jgi:hypothetical protein